MCESKVHAWVNPSRSALCASSTTRQAGGSVWKVTPKSMSPLLLRGLRLPARLGGEAGDRAQEQVRQPRDEEREEQAVVVEPLDKGRVLEDAGEAGGSGCLEETGEDRDHPDEHRGYGPPVPAAGVGVEPIVLVEVGQAELAVADDPVVRDHDRPDRPEEA